MPNKYILHARIHKYVALSRDHKAKMSDLLGLTVYTMGASSELCCQASSLGGGKGIDNNCS